MSVPGLIGDVQPFALLREGPITSVYKGYQRSLDRFVLLKVLAPTFRRDEALTARFEAEAQLVAKIQHPNVVAVYTYGHDDDHAFIATEFVEGQDLHELLAAAGALPVELAAYVTLQAARGLRAAHERDVLHRDLKPSNLLVGHDGQVKLTDFGMASIVGGTADDEALRGTPAYVAPELITGAAPSVESDLFALGATLFEMLAGRRAFVGEEPEAVFDAVMHHDPLSVLPMYADVPPRLRAVCERLLAKEPTARYARAEDVVLDLEVFRADSGERADESALQAFLDDPATYRALAAGTFDPVEAGDGHSRGLPAETHPAPLPTERPAESRRRPWRSVLLTVLLAAATGAGLYAAWAQRQAEPPTWRAPAPALTLDDLFAEPAWPALDSALAAAAERPAEPRSEPEALPAPVRDDVGTLVFNVTPWAEIFIDGTQAGVTPLDEPLRLAPGRHAVVLRNPRFPIYRDSVVVEGGGIDTVNVSLWDGVGRLFLEISPWAEVSINGVVQDTIPPQESPFVVAPGSNRLTLRHPQLGTWTTTFRAVPGRVDTLRFNLQALLVQ